MKKIRLATLFLLTLYCPVAFGQLQNLDVLKTAIADTLSYPAERLMVIDRTASIKRDRGEDIINAYELSSEDNTFATIMIVFSERGALLSPEQEERYNATIEAQIARDKPDYVVRRVDFPEGVYGYTAFGETNMTLAWPERGIDLWFIVSGRGEPLGMDDETYSYYTNFIHNASLEQVREKMVQAMGSVMAYVKAEGIGAPPTEANLPDAAPGTQASAPNAAPAPPGPNAPLTPAEPSALDDEGGNPWLWLAGLLAVALALFFVFKKRQA